MNQVIFEIEFVIHRFAARPIYLKAHEVRYTYAATKHTAVYMYNSVEVERLVKPNLRLQCHYI